MSHLSYFEKIAAKRPSIRKNHNYYWNDITKYCDYFINENCSVLEIGCGTGELLAGLKSTNKTGIDFSPAMIEIARKNNPGIQFEVMDAASVSFDKKFDVIIISNVVGFLPDVQEVFEKLQSVCHSRTKVIVSYYSKLWEPILRWGEKLGLKTKSLPSSSLILFFMPRAPLTIK